MARTARSGPPRVHRGHGLRARAHRCAPGDRFALRASGILWNACLQSSLPRRSVLFGLLAAPLTVAACSKDKPKPGPSSTTTRRHRRPRPPHHADGHRCRAARGPAGDDDRALPGRQAAAPGAAPRRWPSARRSAPRRQGRRRRSAPGRAPPSRRSPRARTSPCSSRTRPGRSWVAGGRRCGGRGLPSRRCGSWPSGRTPATQPDRSTSAARDALHIIGVDAKQGRRRHRRHPA